MPERSRVEPELTCDPRRGATYPDGGGRDRERPTVEQPIAQQFPLNVYRSQWIPATVHTGGFNMNIPAFPGGQLAVAVHPATCGHINSAIGAYHYIPEGGERDTSSIDQQWRVICCCKNKRRIVDPSSAHVDLCAGRDLHVVFPAFKTDMARNDIDIACHADDRGCQSGKSSATGQLQIGIRGDGDDVIAE